MRYMPWMNGLSLHTHIKTVKVTTLYCITVIYHYVGRVIKTAIPLCESLWQFLCVRRVVIVRWHGRRGILACCPGGSSQHGVVSIERAICWVYLLGVAFAAAPGNVLISYNVCEPGMYNVLYSFAPARWNFSKGFGIFQSQELTNVSRRSSDRRPTANSWHITWHNCSQT